jgi:hypothetical protein
VPVGELLYPLGSGKGLTSSRRDSALWSGIYCAPAEWNCNNKGSKAIKIEKGLIPAYTVNIVEDGLGGVL